MKNISEQNLKSVYQRVINSKILMMVYIGTNGILISIPATKQRALDIYHEKFDSVVGFYDRDFGFCCGKALPFADFRNDVAFIHWTG